MADQVNMQDGAEESSRGTTVGMEEDGQAGGSITEVMARQSAAVNNERSSCRVLR